MMITLFLSRGSSGNILPTHKGRGKVCLYPQIPLVGLWDYTEYIVVVGTLTRNAFIPVHRIIVRGLKGESLGKIYVVFCL